MLVLKARCCKAASRSMMRRMLAGKLLDDRGQPDEPNLGEEGVQALSNTCGLGSCS